MYLHLMLMSTVVVVVAVTVVTVVEVDDDVVVEVEVEVEVVVVEVMPAAKTASGLNDATKIRVLPGFSNGISRGAPGTLCVQVGGSVLDPGTARKERSVDSS